MTLGHVDLHPIFAFRTEYSVAEPLVIIGHQQDRDIDTRSVHPGTMASAEPSTSGTSGISSG